MYEIVAGHRRYNAIKKLVAEGRFNKDYEILCKATDDSMAILKQAREQEIKGKTRDLIAERLNISDFSAQKLINKVKRKDEKEKEIPNEDEGEISPPL